MEDIRQTKEWGGYLQGCGWIVKTIKDIHVFIKKIPLTPFSIMKVQRFHGELSIDSLKKIRQKYRIIYTVVEPIKEGVMGWKVSSKPYLPTKTIIVDLGKSKEQLWKDLSTNTRRILNKRSTSIKVLKLRNDKDRDRFYKAWKESSKTWVMGEKKFNKLISTFDKKASLWVSEDGGKLLSGIILLRSKDVANYFQTWTSKDGRRLGSHHYLVWQVILKCKKMGLKYFDFEGILDKRWPQDKWIGFSEFKNKFGGKVFTYPGSFAKWF